MADSNSWQGRTAQNHSSQPNAGSPLTPGSASGNPISFRTNVNRAKTKRWVEAKQYSYDGGDWGDEDDEEEEPPAVSQPLNPTGSSSTDNKLNASGGDQKALPFVRPADIYKRMREDNTNNNPSPRGTSDSLPTPVQSGGPPTQPSPASNDDSSRPTQTIPSIGLPELKRMSGFGADFLGGGDSSFQQNTRPKSQEPPLQHNPSQASQASQGFTSVVHQAFDVPETPESVSGSVARSNSDGTSVISPIISTRSQPDKTPTIPEEPTESSTPTAASQNAAGDVPFFKPGHRRDMSLPSRDNSPSKQPVITDNDTPSAGQAEMTSESPGDFTSPGMSLDALASPPNTSTTLPSSTGQEDFVAPLKLGSQGTSASEAYRGEIPTIIPDVAGNSPHDTDNDRLREEIMRSLSRENSQEPESINQQPPTANQSQSIPHQYEKFWDGQTGPNPDDAPKPLVSEAHPDWNAAHPLANQDPYATNQTPVANASPPAAGLPTKPRLARRFSWESASSAEEPVPQAPAAPALDAGLANQEPEPIPDDSTLMAEKMWREQPLTDSELSDARVEKPRLSIVPPIPTSSSPPEQIMGPTDGPLSREEKYVSADVGTSIDEKKLQGFRDILNKPSPADRIHAFDQTRDQFAVLDTGLTQWLQLTIQEHPEHAGLIQSSQTLSSGFPKTSPITRKFPKLTSLGNLASSKDDGTPAGAGHARRPSGHIGTIVNRQNVEQRGKDFFHTAGAFSGKAGEAAKGLFAKGRSRFRAGGDKDRSATAASAVPSTPRRSLQFQFVFPSGSGNPNSSTSNFSLRKSVTFGSLPLLKFGRNGNPTGAPDAKDPAEMSLGDSRGDERAGKRLRFNDSVDYLRSGEGRVEDRAHDRSQSVPLSFPLADGNQYTSGGFNRASYVSEFEQEMIAALGLSPTESRQPRSLQATTFEPRLALSLTNGFGQGLALHQQRSDPRAKVGTRECDRNDYVTGASNFNNLGPWESLPHLFGESAQQPKPFEHPGHPDASVLSHMVESQPQSAVDSTMPTIPTIRPVHDEDAGNKPLILAKNSPLPHILPPMTFSLDDSSEDDVPPTPPPKDMPRRKPVATHLVPPSNYTARKPSVSTLGADEEIPDRLSEELRNPPSPDLLPKTATEDQSDDPIYGKSLPSAKYSGHSPQVAEENLDLREFAPAFPKSPGSDEILESKRRSIGGVAPSIPGVQSPLRNEVRFSPAARGTLLSSNSFGRQNTNNSKGAREVPYRMESASPSQNSNSKINKLKNFGKRQRTSMGNVLSGFQGGSQKEHQGPQASIQKKNNVSSDQGSDKKNRALGKLGVLFNRQQQPEPQPSKTQPSKSKTNSGQKRQPQTRTKKPSTPSSTGHSSASSKVSSKAPSQPFKANGRRPSGSLDTKDLPAPPVSASPPISSFNNKMPPVQDTRQHASMQIPSSPSANSMIASRFYSSFQSGDSTSPSRPSSQHNRSKSQPLPGQQSMSSIAGSANGVSWSSRPLSDVNEAEERTSQAEQEGEPSSILSKSPEPEAPFQHDMQPQPHQEHDELNDKEDLVDGPAQYQINIYLDDAKSPIVHAQEQFSAPSPGFSLRSDKPHDPRADHSSTYHPTSEPSSPKSLHIDLSAHPHRSEARSLNETAEPVELALTKDDSSEEIIMSSTAYPGQEWTPMHY